MVVSSLAFWKVVEKVDNSSEFMTLAFMCRFIFGIGAGLLRSVIMVARA